MLGLFLPFAQVSKGADVSVDFFYNNLSGGSWIEVGDYGYCWQPEVAVSSTVSQSATSANIGVHGLKKSYSHGHHSR